MKVIDTNEDLKTYWNDRALKEGEKTVGFSGDNKKQHEIRTEEWKNRFAPFWEKYLAGPILMPNVLDFGCGVGRFTKLLPGTYRGTDITKKLLDIAKENHPWARYSLMSNPEKIPFYDEFFDSLWCCTVLQHCVVEGLVEKLVGEFYRVLKPGGSALVYENTMYEGKKVHMWFRKPDEWIKIFKAAGFNAEVLAEYPEGAGEIHTLFSLKKNG